MKPVKLDISRTECFKTFGQAVLNFRYPNQVLQNFANTCFCATFKVQVFQSFFNACNHIWSSFIIILQPLPDWTLGKVGFGPRKAGSMFWLDSLLTVQRRSLNIGTR